MSPNVRNELAPHLKEPMKFHILSDLHVEFFECKLPPVDSDAVLLAGDIGQGMRGISWADATFGNERPLIYVPGNHEYYRGDMTAWARDAAMESEHTAVQVCNPRMIRLEKDGETPVRILAATLWTDFALFGEDKVELCATMTQRALNDYRIVTLDGQVLRWNHTLAIHEQTMAWLKAECQKAKEAGEKVVVVSHHAPSLKSSLPVYQKDPVTAGFGSNLEAFAAEFVDLWVHGHMHNSSDYRLGRCRVIANPRGYPRQRWNVDTTFENPKFNPQLVVEV